MRGSHDQRRLLPYVVHLLLEATIDLIAFGQRGLELVKLLGVEGELGGVGKTGEGGAEEAESQGERAVNIQHHQA